MNARLAAPRRTRTLGAVGAGLMAVLLASSPKERLLPRVGTGTP